MANVYLTIETKTHRGKLPDIKFILFEINNKKLEFYPEEIKCFRKRNQIHYILDGINTSENGRIRYFNKKDSSFVKKNKDIFIFFDDKEKIPNYTIKKLKIWYMNETIDLI